MTKLIPEYILFESERFDVYFSFSRIISFLGEKLIRKTVYLLNITRVMWNRRTDC